MSLENEMHLLKEVIRELIVNLKSKGIELESHIIQNDDSKENKIRKEFYEAPSKSLFNEKTIAIIMNCSNKLLQNKRWAGGGIPFKKIGGKVLYRKKDVIKYLTQQSIRESTSTYKPKGKKK
jgi:hypothetical protein